MNVALFRLLEWRGQEDLRWGDETGRNCYFCGFFLSVFPSLCHIHTVAEIKRTPPFCTTVKTADSVSRCHHTLWLLTKQNASQVRVCAFLCAERMCAVENFLPLLVSFHPVSPWACFHFRSRLFVWQRPLHYWSHYYGWCYWTHAWPLPRQIHRERGRHSSPAGKINRKQPYVIMCDFSSLFAVVFCLFVFVCSIFLNPASASRASTRSPSLVDSMSLWSSFTDHLEVRPSVNQLFVISLILNIY